MNSHPLQSISSEALSEIDALLSESVAEARIRESSIFHEQLVIAGRKVVIFGAGRLGRLCARACDRAGIELAAFCDSNPTLSGISIDGIRVLQPADAALRFGKTALFIVAIWTGTAAQSMTERVRFLRSLGCDKVEPYSSLLWAYGGTEVPFHAFHNPSEILSHAPEIRKLASLLSDAESVQVLSEHLRRLLLGVFPDSPPAPDQYFPDNVLRLGAVEHFVDGGAFVGDTLLEFCRRTGNRFASYSGFEPDPQNFAELQKNLKTLPPHLVRHAEVYRYALGSATGSARFTAGANASSQIDVYGSLQIEIKRLDDIQFKHSPTFLKLDIEGAELAALMGGRELIIKGRPTAAICVYHYHNDFWQAPLMLHSMLPEQPLYLRRHGFDGWETVCYSVNEQHRVG
ncbi:MAG TPA: FkbM family methyltransferase [Opitutaceae bacterium]|nr:FkbM family methyltransferase [Opitutaceae bacterium]